MVIGQKQLSVSETIEISIKPMSPKPICQQEQQVPASSM